MELEVLSISGKGTGRKVTLPTVFQVEPNEHAIYLDVKRCLAALRRGTHKAKERGEVAGSTRKIKKQKGTGGARAGSIRNPLFVGGGRVFGPRPRSYELKLNKKVKALARHSALSMKANQGAIKVLEDFTLDQPKTKEFIAIHKNIGLLDRKATYILGAEDKNVYLSSRNLKKCSVLQLSDLNTYKIMNGGSLVFLEGTLSKMADSE